MTTRALLVDGDAVLRDLYARALAERLGWVVTAHDEAASLTAGGSPDLAIVGLSSSAHEPNGLDVLLALHAATPATPLVALAPADGDSELLRATWEALPLACALSRATTVDEHVRRLRAVARDGRAGPDPVLIPHLPARRSPWRTAEAYERLVRHAGHAKLWKGLFSSGTEVTYHGLIDATGLKTNTLKNYRSQLLDELALHGLQDPSIREMQRFAVRCRPLLAPHVTARLGPA